MLDVRTNPEAPAAPAPHTAIRREDYRPPDWLVPEIRLDFDLGVERTVVRATLTVERNGDHDRPLRLDGDELKLLSVKAEGGHRMDGPTLVIDLAGNSASIETEVEISPAANTKLMGLYASNGMLCTQCEAEGFRRITFFPDRPDVLSKYKVRMEGDAAAFPILLSNGNRVAEGQGADGRHWAEWQDPFPKPCYLFALVAGDLKPNRDRFTTMSGRNVDLAIWVREADLPKTAHAMASLKLAMKWDEDVYGREYDLDQFNIVAVSDFNMGAMENKSLNIFNSAYVLADQDTATDADFDNIARVVAHEYFHNWSGDRVTCRDWFQLSLKEGFTVFRDQSFGADMGSPAVKRIEDVRVLRAVQFPEDQGPLAHPVRPDSYIEISNFYTTTIYNKGAELIRMFHTVLGPEKFRKGTDLYFERHDGEAATCDDFVTALEDGSGVDLTPFKIWYSQAGTPKVKARLEHDAGGEDRHPASRAACRADARPAGQAGHADSAQDRADRRRQRRGNRGGAADHPRPAQAKRHLRQCRREAVAVDQPRFLGAGHRRCCPRSARARAAGADRYRSVRPLRSDAGHDDARADRRRSRRSGRCRAGHPSHRRDTAFQLARPGVQGRSDPAAERKPDLRPHGGHRHRRHPRRAGSAAQGDRLGAGAGAARRASAPTMRRAATCRQRPRAYDACAPWR